MGEVCKDSCDAHKHQNVISAEQYFDDQVARMTHSVDSHQPFPLATPVIIKWAYE